MTGVSGRDDRHGGECTFLVPYESSFWRNSRGPFGHESRTNFAGRAIVCSWGLPVHWHQELAFDVPSCACEIERNGALTLFIGRSPGDVFMLKTTLPLPATTYATRQFVRTLSGILSHRALWAVIASGALSGCLVAAPECKRCSDGESTSDGGVSEDSEGAGDNVADAAMPSSYPTAATTEGTSTPPATGDDATAVTDDDTRGESSETVDPTSEVTSVFTDGSTTDDQETNGVPTGGDDSATDTDALTNDAQGSSSPDTSTSDSTGSDPTDTSPSMSTGTDTSAPTTTSEEQSTEPPTPVHEVKWHESFEGGWAQWTYEGDTWGVGTPTNAAAPTAQDGSQVVGTGLAGPYHRENSRVRSPKFIVPPAVEQPYLRYWYWYSLEAGDTAQIQVRVGEEVNWVDLHSVTDTISTVAGHGDRWMQALLPLDEFGGQEIQLSFALTAAGENCSLPGFFIDNVSLETGPMNICSCQGFNNGNAGDWSIEGGQWGIGAPGNVDAPAPAAESNGLAGTKLSGTYESLAAAPVARLSSPTFKVVNPYQKVRFYYWYSFTGAGRGKVQARTVGEPWEDVAGYEFTNTGDEEFTYVELSLEPWVGEIVQFGFLLENGGGADTPSTPGFYVDEFFYIE